MQDIAVRGLTGSRSRWALFSVLLADKLLKWYIVALIHVQRQPYYRDRVCRPFHPCGTAHTFPCVLPAGVALTRRDLSHMRSPMNSAVALFYARVADRAGD